MESLGLTGMYSIFILMLCYSVWFIWYESIIRSDTSTYSVDINSQGILFNLANLVHLGFYHHLASDFVRSILPWLNMRGGRDGGNHITF